jgi:lysozyme
LSAPRARALEVASVLAKEFEGLYLAPYFCPAGVATQGYGTVWKPDGTKVQIGDKVISKKVAEEWLEYGLTDAMLGVLKASPNLIKYPDKLGAVTDFAFNLGVTRYRASTFRKKLESEDWADAVVELKKWRLGGGKVLPGLVRRREAESLYIL